MATYKPRLKAPSVSDKHWIHTSKGGYNKCILISGNSCLPNCVGYAWGRFYEIMGKAPKLSLSNAENWYGYNDGYKRGKTPKEGAVICWRKGKAGVASDGAGHVAIVEKVYGDGSILISESGYKAFRFRTSVLKPPYSIGGTYVLQGFIYNPAVSDSKPASKDPQWKTLYAMNFRDKASLKGKVITVIPKGAVLTGTVDKDGWLHTTYGGKKGYVCQKGEKTYCKKV